MTEVLVLAGYPCAGKGDLAQALEKRLGYVAISSSKLIEASLARLPSLEREAVEKEMAAGTYFDDEKMIELVWLRLKELPFNQKLVLDGFPRTVPQARYVVEELPHLGYRPIFFSIEAPFDVCLRRLSNRILQAERGEAEKRADDRAEVLKQRYDLHKEMWTPVEKYLTEEVQKKINIIDATQSRGDVIQQVLRVVEPPVSVVR